MFILHHKLLIPLIIHGHIIWIIYTLSLELFGACCMLNVSKNICCNSFTWFFSPCWLLLWTATYCWDFIQTHKQQLHFYFISLFPNSQVYDIAWSLSSSWSLFCFVLFFPLSPLCSSFVGYRARVLLTCESEFLIVT